MLTGTTTLVGLLRDPLRESLSPRMHNAAFEAAGLDWAYVALGVEPTRLEEAVAGLVALGFRGANVTIPHKTGVLAYCDELDSVAERAGSVNTLVIDGGRVQGSSTDGLGGDRRRRGRGRPGARPRRRRGGASGGDRARRRGVRLPASFIADTRACPRPGSSPEEPFSRTQGCRGRRLATRR